MRLNFCDSVFLTTESDFLSFIFCRQFPLLSKSEKLNRLVFESRDTEKDHIILSDIPGGADTFELVARFFYGGKFELTPYNVAALRCAADYLEMSDSSHGTAALLL